jgi:hypothetical protein
MAKKIRINQTLKDAIGVKTVWATIPDFKMGTVAFNDFTAASDAANAAHNDHESKGEQLSDAKADRDEKVRQLDDLITRFKSGIRAQYGPDSVQYQQAGGTRSSLRKPPKKAAAPATMPQGIVTAAPATASHA